MAQYKYDTYLHRIDNGEFDKKHAPGSEAAYAGIYRCAFCGHEIGIAKHHKLPSQNDQQHSHDLGKIEWQLLVFAESKKAV